jgi:hypothetical protein
MRLSYVFAVVVLVNALSVGAAPYIDEGFEGAFPPAGWAIENTSSAGWDRTEDGPWGRYAAGWASSSNGHEAHAGLTTSSFNVAVGTVVEFRYDYRLSDNGYPSTYHAGFYLYYIDRPHEYVFQCNAPLSVPWCELTGNVTAPRNGNMAAHFDISVYNGTSHSSAYVWELDNFLVNDKQVHAVAPTSLGRVRALFR